MTCMKGLLIVLLVVIYIHSNEATSKLRKLFEWGPGEVTFTWSDIETKHRWLRNGEYIPKNNVPLGIAVHPNEPKMFVTVPRWKAGVASTLNWCPIGTGNVKESLRPYPNWKVNDIYSGTDTPYKIISVIRVFLDVCDRLWVMDNGIDDKMGNTRVLEPPKLLIFDVNTNVLIRKVVFDSSIHYGTKSSFGKTVVDVTWDTCGNAFAYITDVTTPGLIVYNFNTNRIYRIENNYLYRDPLKSYFQLKNGTKIQSNLHVDGITLSGLYKDGYRNLYASSQVSNKLFVTSTKWVQDESHRNDPDLFQYLGEQCATCQAGGAQVIDEKTGVMIYSDLGSHSIRCWSGDISDYSPSTQDRLVVSPELDYVSDVTITLTRVFFAISNQLREFFYSDTGVTTRVFFATVDDLISFSICQPQ